ncbi:MAG TPA: glycoside hydrolase family 38 C-terminal domain-containing protein, partial [Tepidisphaeraceae bacterium]|nr:glycoside hydrolase family 38 C-terminal domain-containing protein [Tepidisphaeraceae bacterium]
MNHSSRTLLGVLLVLIVCSSTAHAGDAPDANTKRDTFWIIPHTHWEGAVFMTREEYLDVGLPHIVEALRLLKEHPNYTFVLDQVAYVKPFLERYPEHEALFRKMIAQGRLQLVLGMDVMPDDNMPGGETLIRQIQYGKGYYRRELGVDVTCGWLLDTFGHNGQLPQILKLGGYKSFWFFRGVPRQDFPSEFLWEGIDGTHIPAFWLPQGYGLFFGSPNKLPAFENFARHRFTALDRNAHGHDRVALAGADVSEPEPALPEMVEQANGKGDLPFVLKLGVPKDFEAAIAGRHDLPVFKGELNPIFQGIYSSRIELKYRMRTLQRLLTTAEKLSAIDSWLGNPSDDTDLWRAWEPVLFNETHDQASGVMTDHVYEDVQRQYDFSERLANELIDQHWEHIASRIDTRGEGVPVIVFNTLGWSRTDIAQTTVGFATDDVKRLGVVHSDGRPVPVQIEEISRYPKGGILSARVAFAARNVPAMGWSVYHVVANPKQNAVESIPAPSSNSTSMENDTYKVTVDPATGAIDQVRVNAGDWDALKGPANVVARQEDKGDLWEPYHTLDGGSRIAMTTKEKVPARPAAVFSNDFRGKPGAIIDGPVYREFSVSHPFDAGQFTTTIRLPRFGHRIEITTTLVNRNRYVRYRALFPTNIRDGRNFEAIPLGAIERPEAIEFPAQDWVNYGNSDRGVALLNDGLPGNVVTDGTIMVSLLRSHTLGAYSTDLPSSNTGFELNVARTM